MKNRYALFGQPVAHSRSPAVHAAFARQTGMSFEFELVDCDAAMFPERLREFGRRGGRGANVTSPHKLAAFELAKLRSGRATRAGAVNTLRFETDGLVFGDNTDGAGLVTDLVTQVGLDLVGIRILVIGAGGAARGILGPLLECNPAEIIVANRDPLRAAQLAARYSGLGRISGVALDTPGKGYDLVINATTTSLAGTIPHLPPSVLGAGSVAYDLAYRDDGSTAFTRWARQLGAATAVDGWGMLVEQAAESFLVWFGVRPETSEVRTREFRSGPGTGS